MHSFSGFSIRPFFPLLCLLALLSGCNPSEEEVPLDDIQIQFKVHRLELEFLEAGKQIIAEPQTDSIALYQKFFADDRAFLADWLFYGDMETASDSVLATIMAEFLADSNTVPLLEDIERTFPASGPNPADDLEDFFKRFSHYFPDKIIPTVVTFADGYPHTIQAGLEQMFISPRHLGIGLQYLMGPDYLHYPPDMPKYLRRRMSPEHLPASVAHRYADAMIPPPSIETNPTLIDHIVHQGIQMRFVDKLLGPAIPDSMKLFYTSSQYEWAVSFEKRAYKDLVPVLYDIDSELIRRYIDDSPFTSQLHRESAPRLGQFIGWKIVDQYMEKETEKSLADLIEQRDFQRIFKASGYRP